MSIPTVIRDIVMENDFEVVDVEPICRAMQVKMGLAMGGFCLDHFKAAVAYAAQGVVGTEAERKRLEELERIFNGEVYEPSRPLYNFARECIKPAGDDWARLEAEHIDLMARTSSLVIWKELTAARGKKYRKAMAARRLAKALDARLPAATQAPVIRARF